jgi:hypothetical protein
MYINMAFERITGPRISGGRTGELARMAERPLHALVRGREAPEIKRMVIRNAVRGARSVPRTKNSPGALAVR